MLPGCIIDAPIVVVRQYLSMHRWERGASAQSDAERPESRAPTTGIYWHSHQCLITTTANRHIQYES